MDDLKPLRCFVALADELNFSRAAERVHLTQPALSSQIRSLEARLGFALCHRTTRRVALTDRGSALLPAARRLIEEGRRLDALAAELRGAPRRKLTLGAAFYTIDIPERVRLLEGFFERHADVALDVSPAWQREVVEDLGTRFANAAGQGPGEAAGTARQAGTRQLHAVRRGCTRRRRP